MDSVGESLSLGEKVKELVALSMDMAVVADLVNNDAVRWCGSTFGIGID
jgi:hypothetical protein